MKKHILLISQCFYPESFRINDICREWVRRGYRVTAVTAIPNYPEGVFYPGYGLFRKRTERWEGIDIIHLPIVSRGHSALRLILNYYSFVISGFFWSRFSRLKPDFVFSFETSPMLQVKLGCWFSKRRKIPHYLYVQDLWPDNLEAVAGIHNRQILNHYDRGTRRIFARCSKIFATSPSFAETIRSRMRSNRENVFYLPQYAEELYVPVPRKPLPELPEDGNFRVVFTGNIGAAQGLDVLPRAAEELKRRGVDDVRFVIVGDGRNRENLIRDIEERRVASYFTLIPRRPAEEIPAILAACDAAFISFLPAPIFEQAIPAKLQSYLACAKPILASAVGETARIVKEADCGVVCPIGDASALADGILELRRSDLTAIGQRALAYSRAHFEKQTLIDELERRFESGT